MASKTEAKRGTSVHCHSAILTYGRLPGGHDGLALHKDQAPEEADRIITGALPGI